MSNLLYPKFKEALLDKKHDLNTDAIKVVLSDAADYTYSAAHDFFDDVPSGARVATSPTLTTPTITNGVFDSDDFTFGVVTGDVSEQLIMYNHGMGGADNARGLIAFWDSVTGLPITPNGTDVINVAVHASGWFNL